MPYPIRLVQASAESLPFRDGEFDTVVITFGLCTIPDAEASVCEALRVLKPNALIDPHRTGLTTERTSDCRLYSRVIGGVRQARPASAGDDDR